MSYSIIRYRAKARARPEQESELEFELDFKLEVHRKSKPKSCISSNDEVPPSKLRRIQNVWTGEDED